MNKLTVSLLPLLLVGCSSSTPSASDIKKSLEDDLKSCAYASVVDLKKINGEAGPTENSYFVETTFALKFAPHPDADEYQAEIDKLKSQAKDLQEFAKEESLKRYGTIGGYEFTSREDGKLLQQISNLDLAEEEVRETLRIAKKKLWDDYKAFQKEQNEYMAKANVLNEDAGQLFLKAKTEYSKDCKISPFITKLMIGEQYFRQDLIGKVVWGAEYPMEYRLPMRKTENGWLINK